MTLLTCSQLKIQLQEIKSLKGDFDFELLKIKDTRDTALALVIEKEIRDKIALLERQCSKMYVAEQIFGQDFLGPDAIEATFGFKPQAKDIPAIPFSKTELVRAKELEQFLVLRVDKTPAGQPLTMKNMNEMKAKSTKDGEKTLWDMWHQRDEAFFNTDTPLLGWALVSKEVIPKSTDKSYLGQTEALVDYLIKSLKGQPISVEYKEAIQEFLHVHQGNIKIDMNRNWELAVEKLERLKINQLFRQTPVEVLYDILLMKEKTGEYILSKTFTQTNCRSSSGKLVRIGMARKEGLDISSSQPHFSSHTIGVSFSRRK